MPDLMNTNKDQHESFQSGLHAMQQYITASLQDVQAFEHVKLLGLIEGFGSLLREHLADEILTLIELRTYGDKLSAIHEVLVVTDVRTW